MQEFLIFFLILIYLQIVSRVPKHELGEKISILFHKFVNEKSEYIWLWNGDLKGVFGYHSIFA